MHSTDTNFQNKKRFLEMPSAHHLFLSFHVTCRFVLLEFVKLKISKQFRFVAEFVEAKWRERRAFSPLPPPLSRRGQIHGEGGREDGREGEGARADAEGGDRGEREAGAAQCSPVFCSFGQLASALLPGPCAPIAHSTSNRRVGSRPF